MELFFRSLAMVGFCFLGILIGFCICGDAKSVAYVADKIAKDVATTILEMFTGRKY